MMCKSNCNATLSGYGGLDAPMPQACLMLGIPVLDTTAISDNLIMQSISFPMATNGQPDESPWGSMSYAPLDYVAGLYAAIGATVYNLEISRPNVAKLRRNTDREDDCLIGYLTGDQERLGKGIIGAFSETIAK